MTGGARPLVPSRLAPGGVSAHGPRRAPRSVVGGYIALTKPRIIELLLITTVPTMVLAEKGWPSWGLVIVTLVGGTLAAGGANAINMVVDRDIDRLMERTKNRPLVTGLVQPRGALIFALSLEVAAFAVLWAGANLLSAVLALSATLFYVFVYTLWLKRTSRRGRGGSGPGRLGGGPEFAGLGAISPVHRHFPVDPTPFLGSGHPPRRRLPSGPGAHAPERGPHGRDRAAHGGLHGGPGRGHDRPRTRG